MPVFQGTLGTTPLNEVVNLEGWDTSGGREGDARGRGYGDICVCTADSLCDTAETNTPL